MKKLLQIWQNLQIWWNKSAWNRTKWFDSNGYWTSSKDKLFGRTYLRFLDGTILGEAILNLPHLTIELQITRASSFENQRVNTKKKKNVWNIHAFRSITLKTSKYFFNLQWIKTNMSIWMRQIMSHQNG
jgi:hypothetical protein